VYIACIWLNTHYIGFYEAMRLEHYQYLWRFDEDAQEFVVIDEETARQFGLTIIHDVDVVA
jgi:hypothetical protein